MAHKKGHNTGMFALLAVVGIIIAIFIFIHPVNLKPLAFVQANANGITVGGLSQTNAMWVGGVFYAMWLFGSWMITKKH